MKTIRIAVLSIMGFASVVSFAQTTKVIPVDPEDAKTIQALYDLKDEIDKEIADLRNQVVDKYLIEDRIPATKSDNSYKTVSAHFQKSDSSLTMNDAGEWISYLPGFEDGKFQFSDDYKYLVPQKSTSTVCSPSTVALPGGSTLNIN